MLEVRGARLAFALAVLGAGSSAWAQNVPPGVEPGAIREEFRTEPELYRNGAVRVPSASGPVAPAGAESAMLVLETLTVEGVTAFSEDRIEELYADKLGTTISLADLFGIAQDITRLYAEEGYPLSVAFLPAQEITNGAARIVVYEGYVAELEITGDPGRARPAIERLGAELMGERPLSSAVLERYVLLANDLPGISVKAVIDHASEGPGAIKVIFSVERKAMDFALTLNNRGSRALGRERAQASAALNNLLFAGDRLRGDVVQTFETEELTFFSGGYEIPIGGEGLRLGAALSYSDAAPGTELLRALDVNSEGLTGAVEASYPLIRRRAHNVILGGSFEYGQYESFIFGDSVSSLDTLWVGRASVALDAAGEGGAASSLRLQISHGFDLGEATRKTDPDKSRDRGDAVFSSLLVDATRVQPLSSNFELSVAGRAQVASRKLLASEECGYGGAGMGRAFDNFEIAGDYCLMATAELRRRPETLFGSLTAAPYGFVDAGQIWTHGSGAGEVSEDNAESVGGGLRLSFKDSFSAYVEYAQPLSHDVELEGDRDGRVFFGLTATR